MFTAYPPLFTYSPALLWLLLFSLHLINPIIHLYSRMSAFGQTQCPIEITIIIIHPSSYLYMCRSTCSRKLLGNFLWAKAVYIQTPREKLSVALNSHEKGRPTVNLRLFGEPSLDHDSYYPRCSTHVIFVFS